MKLRPIDDCNSGKALAVLKRGFPERTETFWADALRKILSSPSRRDAEPIGFLMAVGAEDVGIVLTIPGQKARQSGRLDVVNLAAWYVDKPHRWLAARMLQKVVAPETSVFTDLTPSAAAQQINQRLGFEILNEGFQVFPLPWTALRARKQARVISLDQATLDDATRATLDHHAELGCLVAVLRNGADHPLIFSRLTRRGVRGARVILTDSKRLIVDNLADISRFLLRNRLLFLQMDANRADATIGSSIARWSSPTYVKGATDRSGIDHTYSELVFLG
jgi:hypothetical protein